MSLKLKIVSPEKIEFDGYADSVTVPGTLGAFEILENHAPILPSLERGLLTYKSNSENHQLAILGGFVEVQKNEVNVCVECNSDTQQ